MNEQGAQHMDYKNKTGSSALPLSESTIPTALADIRRRCSDLLDANGEIALSLEDEGGRTAAARSSYDPYDRGP